MLHFIQFNIFQNDRSNFGPDNQPRENSLKVTLEGRKFRKRLRVLTGVRDTRSTRFDFELFLSYSPETRHIQLKWTTDLNQIHDTCQNSLVFTDQVTLRYESIARLRLRVSGTWLDEWILGLSELMILKVCRNEYHYHIFIKFAIFQNDLSNLSRDNQPWQNSFHNLGRYGHSESLVRSNSKSIHSPCFRKSNSKFQSSDVFAPNAWSSSKLRNSDRLLQFGENKSRFQWIALKTIRSHNRVDLVSTCSVTI